MPRVLRLASRFGLPAVALFLLVFAVSAAIQPPRIRAQPVETPPSSPYDNAVAGTGTVEPQSELIAIASELSGVVRRVYVQPGQSVAAGAPLFELDSRAARAALAAAEAEAASAEAAARAAEVAVADERQRLTLFEAVDDPAAVSRDELERRRFALSRAEAAAAQARASARAARAAAEVRRVDLQRLVVTAPIGGRIYDVDVRVGEFAAAGAGASPLMTIGSDGPLHIRAEFDEADVARLSSRGRAVATLRGRAGTRIPLTFVRFEPAVTEKRALTGGSERVDTRVVEAIYSFDAGQTPVFLGQRVDVFVEAAQ